MPTPEELRQRFQQAIAPTTTPTPEGGSRLNIAPSDVNAPDSPDPVSEFKQRLEQNTTGLEPRQQEGQGKVMDALSLLNKATSGREFIRSVTGKDIANLDTPLPDWVDRGIQEGIDLVVNPATAVAIVFAPVAVPARLAASPLGRLAFRLGEEAVIGGAATLAVRKAEQILPEDAPTWVKLAVPAIAGLGTAAGTAHGINSSVRGLSAEAAKAAAVSDARLTARGIGNEYLAPLESLDEIRAAFGETDSQVIRTVMTRLGIDPVLGETTEAGQLTHAWLRQKAVARDAGSLGLAGAFPKGLDAFDITSDGFIRNVKPNGRGILWNDLFADAEAPRKYGFNEYQTEQFNQVHKVVEETQTLLKQHGIERPVLDTGDRLYVPRQVRNAPEGVYQPPSNAALGRVHQEATDGFLQHGTNYLGPEETLRLHIQTAYKEIADAQFSDAIERLTVTTSDAFANTKRGARMLADWRGKVDEFRKLSRLEGTYSRRVTNLEARLSELKRNGSGPAWETRFNRVESDLTEAKAILNEQLRPQLAAARKAKAESRTHLVADRKRFANSPRRVPGSLFGRNEGKIDVDIWKGRFIPKDQHEALARWFDPRTGVQLAHQSSGPIRTVEQIGDALRTASAGADFAMPFVQGIPLLATDPVRWTKMAVQHYRAFLQPGTRNRYIANNLESLQEMVTQGRVPIGDVEFFTSTRNGGLLERAANSKVGAQTLGRFQNSYDTGLLVARHQMWDALKPTWTGTPEDLGKYIRNLTGGMDTAALGVGQAQRAAESLLLFSPKLLRSTAALFVDAMRPWTASGAQSAHTILRLSAAAASVFVLANMAVGVAAGDTEEQVDERVRKTLSPWEGKEFLAVRVGDEWHGVGGQIRSMTQMVANSIVGITDKAGLTNEQVSGNPLTSFLMGRQSPVARAGLAGAELATGEKLNLLPFDTIDSVPDLLGLVGTSALPFAVQGALQAYQDPLTGISPTLFAADMLGSRASAISPFERRDDAAVQETGYLYRNMTPLQKNEFDEKHPDLTEAAKEFGDLQERQYNAEIDKINATTTGTLEAIADRLETGKYPTRSAMREDVEGALSTRAIRTQQARSSSGLDSDFSSDTFGGRLLDTYFNTFELARVNPTDPNSPLDFEILDQLQGTLMTAIDEEAFGDPEEARAFLDDRRRFQLPEALDGYLDNKDVIQRAGYWKVKDDAFARYQPRINSLPLYSDVTSPGELQARILYLRDHGDVRGAGVGDQYLKEINSQTSGARETLRYRNPALDRALYENGYTTVRLTRD